MTHIRHTRTSRQRNENLNTQEQIEEEMQEMLHPNPEPVYSPTTINEPSFIREYAPLPLEDARHNIRPSAPNLHQEASESDPQFQTKDNPTGKMYPSLANRLCQFIPKFNHHSSPAKSDSKPSCTGSHTTCSYVAGYGMVWEDLCTCNMEQDSGAIPKTF